MKKGSWLHNPLVGLLLGALIGLVLTVVYIVFESAISRPMYRMFGSYWEWLKPLQFYFLLGLFNKAIIWMQVIGKLDVEPMSAADFAGVPKVEASSQPAMNRFALDFPAFQSRTNELESLGFVLQREGAVKTDKKALPVFVRFFRDAEGHWAEVFQMFPRGAAPKPVCLTFSTRLQNGWTCTDSTFRPNWAMWMIRRPHSLGKFYAREKPTEYLWRSHLERCARLSEKTGADVSMLNVDEYLAQSLELVKQGRDAMLWRSTPVAMIRSALARPEQENWRHVERYARRGS